MNHVAGLVHCVKSRTRQGDVQTLCLVLLDEFVVLPVDHPDGTANDALVQPESRAAYQRIIDHGWTDAIRELHPDRPTYKFWHYRWERDAELRLDHLLVSPWLSKRLVAAGVEREVRNRVGASDYAPAWIVIKR